MRLKRIGCFVLSLILLLSMSALAELLKQGDSGEDVLTIQLRLKELGYTATETDGVFGEGTVEALMAFQRRNELLETGIADEVTVRVLMSDEAERYEPDDLWACFEEGVADSFLPMPMMGAANGSALYDAGADFDTREYTTFHENGFHGVLTAPLSTFAADVDTASWSQIRQLLLRGEKVPQDCVRIEEMLNYFAYDYARPKDGEPLGVTMELGDCPWNEGNKLLLIGLQAEEIETEDVPKNLVFLIDVSGSMDDKQKLPLVKRAFMMLLEELSPKDTVSVVTYAASDEVLLDGIPVSDGTKIMETIDSLMAGGGTNGADGIRTAYELARKHYVEGGVNRILLATDGDLNIGASSEGDLARLVSGERESGVSLTVLGFGGYNYKDNRMEALADYGDGNYWYIDTIHEARRALITEGGGTFHTVAKDVKLQLDFNPAVIRGYRLIGYEDRLLNAEDFANDDVDGGEIGSGHRVTALYELVPVGSDFDFSEVAGRYTEIQPNGSTEWLTLSVRAKVPEGDVSELYSYVLKDPEEHPAGENLRFAAGLAEFGMLLRESDWRGSSSWESALELLRNCESVSGDVYKEELVYLVGLAAREDGVG